MLPVNALVVGRDGLVGIGGATAGQGQGAASAVLPLNDHGGGRDGLGDIQ